MATWKSPSDCRELAPITPCTVTQLDRTRSRDGPHTLASGSPGRHAAVGPGAATARDVHVDKSAATTPTVADLLRTTHLPQPFPGPARGTNPPNGTDRYKPTPSRRFAGTGRISCRERTREWIRPTGDGEAAPGDVRTLRTR